MCGRIYDVMVETSENYKKFYNIIKGKSRDHKGEKILKDQRI